MPTYTVDYGDKFSSSLGDGLSALAKAMTPDHKSEAEARLLGHRMDSEIAGQAASYARAGASNASARHSTALAGISEHEIAKLRELDALYANPDTDENDLLRGQARFNAQGYGTPANSGTALNLFNLSRSEGLTDDEIFAGQGRISGATGTKYGDTFQGFRETEENTTSRAVAKQISDLERELAVAEVNNDAALTRAISNQIANLKQSLAVEEVRGENAMELAELKFPHELSMQEKKIAQEAAFAEIAAGKEQIATMERLAFELQTKGQQDAAAALLEQAANLKQALAVEEAKGLNAINRDVAGHPLEMEKLKLDHDAAFNLGVEVQGMKDDTDIAVAELGNASKEDIAAADRVSRIDQAIQVADVNNAATLAREIALHKLRMKGNPEEPPTLTMVDGTDEVTLMWAPNDPRANEFGYVRMGSGPRTGNTGRVVQNPLEEFFSKDAISFLEAVNGRQLQADQEIKLANTVTQLMDGVATGRLTAASLPVQQWAKAFGFAAEDLASKEALMATFGEYAMNRIQDTKGAVSEMEMRYFMDISPGLSKTPAGNKILMDIQRGIAQRDLDAAQIVADMGTGEFNEREIKAAVMEHYLNTPILSAEVAAQNGLPPVPAPGMSVAAAANAAGAATGAEAEVPVPDGFY